MHKQAITRTYRNKKLFQIILRWKNMMLQCIWKYVSSNYSVRGWLCLFQLNLNRHVI